MFIHWSLSGVQHLVFDIYETSKLQTGCSPMDTNQSTSSRTKWYYKMCWTIQTCQLMSVCMWLKVVLLHRVTFFSRLSLRFSVLLHNCL